MIEVGAPLLAPVVQDGLLLDEEAMAIAREHRAPFREAGFDTLVLGCTHYPSSP